ncbi:MAG: hypothetical protein HZB46_14335 [Solirubrobacterales bacterium]|nr:hypothetical protein [Solirubrobacterales bacterium]
MAETVGDPLDHLRDQLRATQDAAERLAREVPPQGWASPADREATAQEVQALVALLQALRDVVPPELWDQVREVVRQLLLLLRAILDYVVDRLDAPASAPRREPPPVEDIPIA